MTRWFTWRREGRDDATLTLFPMELGSVGFMSGADFGYSVSPKHGQWYSYLTHEGRHIFLKFRYKWPADFTHDIHMRLGHDQIWRPCAPGYEKCSMVEMFTPPLQDQAPSSSAKRPRTEPPPPPTFEQCVVPD